MRNLNINDLESCSGGMSYITTTERVNVEGISDRCVQAFYNTALQHINSIVPESAFEYFFYTNCSVQDAILFLERADSPILLDVTLK